MKDVPVLLLMMEFFFPDVHSLKEKRMILNRLKDRLKKFNVSVAEADFQDVWQRSLIAIAVVSGGENHLRQQSQRILDEVDRLFPSYLINYKSEII